MRKIRMVLSFIKSINSIRKFSIFDKLTLIWFEKQIQHLENILDLIKCKINMQYDKIKTYFEDTI